MPRASGCRQWHLRRPLPAATSTLSDLQLTRAGSGFLGQSGRRPIQSALAQARASAVDAEAARLGSPSALRHAYIELQTTICCSMSLTQLSSSASKSLRSPYRNAADGLAPRGQADRGAGCPGGPADKVIPIAKRGSSSPSHISFAALLGQGPDRGKHDRAAAATWLGSAMRPPCSLGPAGRRPDLMQSGVRAQQPDDNHQGAPSGFLSHGLLVRLRGLPAWSGCTDQPVNAN